MIRHQRGVSLTGLLFWGIIIALVAVVGIKVAPEVIEFYKIKKVVAATANNAGDKTVNEIRAIYDRYANIDQISAIQPADLDITKEGGRVVVGFAYEKRIPLFLNVSLLLDFEGSSSGR